MMINLLIVTSIVILIGLPFLLVLSACISGTRSDKRVETPKQPAQAYALEQPIILFQHAQEEVSG